ncbi:MAG: hypothetical protein JWR61_494 [Ferruginibacter sp.]|uniref:EpsG family protein n=1 Tax=Ferruginibacter sp. TaxID=1940288 RepID=UPI0026593648|nr:EpsG family protein [Ferruginibacter sp.]MDB5275539.1 hypothetical protein [Ferruginibacter sp.]
MGFGLTGTAIKNRKNSNNIVLDYFFYFLWPFGMLVKSLFDFKNPRYKNFLWFFTVFVGLCLITTSEELDAFRYAREFELIAKTNKTIGDIFSIAYSDSGSLDIFRPLMMYLISRFTNNSHIFFAFVGVIYGFLFSRNFCYIIDKVQGDFTKFQILVLFSFLFIFPIQALQFVRFSTAAHLFFFGAMPFLFEKNTKYVFVAIASVFVHFSFFIPVAVLLVYIYLPKNVHLFFIFYILTSFFIQVKLESINTVLESNAPELLEDKVAIYGNEGYAESEVESISTANWYIQYFGKAIDYFIAVMIIYVYVFNRKYLMENMGLFTLFGFTLFFAGVANLVSLFPSGSRFIGVARLFAIAVIVLNINSLKNRPGFKMLQLVTAPVLIFFIIVALRFLVDTTGLLAYIGNPFLFFIYQDHVPVIDFIKSILGS